MNLRLRSNCDSERHSTFAPSRSVSTMSPAAPEKALAEAEEVREKELAEYNAEEKDAITSVASLKGAINSLSKANPGSAFEQQEALIQVAHVLRRRTAAALAAVAPHRRSDVRAFLNSPSEGISLLQASSSLRASQPASGAIFGML